MSPCCVHCEVFVRKNCPIIGNWIKRTVTLHSDIQNSCWNIRPVTLASSVALAKWVTITVARPQPSKEERRRDKTHVHAINIHSLMASGSKTKLVDGTPVWYSSIPDTANEACCLGVVPLQRYNSTCPPYVRSPASLSFRWTQNVWSKQLSNP